MKKVFTLRRSLILSVLFLLTISIFPGWCQNKPIELTYGHPSPPQTITGQLHASYAKEIEEATNGRVKITIYPAESLFKLKDTVSAIETGITDIGEIQVATSPGVFNLAEVMFLPFLYTNSSPKLPTYEINTRVINDLLETMPEMQQEFARFKVLYIGGQETYYIASIKKPIQKLEDLKGLKIRVVGRYATKVIEKLGATAVSIPVSDLYDAAAKGVIDGALVISDFIDSFSVHQVLPYWTKVPLWNSVIVKLMNKETWESLPTDIQEQIMSVSGYDKGLEQAEVRFGMEAQKTWEELMEKDGKHITYFNLPEDEVLRWKELAGEPIWDEWVKEMEDKGLAGKKILDKAIELYEKYE